MASPNSAARIDETDFLASLEERIVRAVQLVSQLRQEKDAVEKELQSIRAEKDSAQENVSELQRQSAQLTEEVEALKAERKQVRGRIEKLLGQMDLLAG